MSSGSSSAGAASEARGSGLTEIIVPSRSIVGALAAVSVVRGSSDGLARGNET